ncbi:isoleucine--tRNA ligase [Rhizomonospora bruguierae]|uniref:isoleucine--tRNA ligase n=1 Tax=Rhizomonospora bruguierae TaxID=1581705 RepID=UPI001BCB894E|nr:isoleucine--tRNA ligase [Micromonospora sp. NBRC 107566]
MSETSAFAPAPARVDLPAVDHEVLALWRERDVFRRSLEQTAGGPRWVFYEGPPTANGRPGVHHVEARVFKDVFPRYRTMKGYSVPRRAGWDCHGLPVEIAVEKELGLNGKRDIERVGIAEFNARCRESVQRHVGEFAAMTDRLGYWVDLSAAYWTMDPRYVESVWWALRQIFDKGLLAEDHRVAPYCPRCGTGLSDHEVAQGYETVVDPSVYVRLPAVGPVAGIEGVDLLIWTTTPWTLVSNTAVAVHPEVTYAVARTGAGTFVVAEPLVRAALGDDAEVLATLPGRELERLPYRRPFDLVDVPDAQVVVLAEYVTTEDGTGLVHQAPAFGADDLATCRRYGLPVVNPIGPDGRFLPGVGLVGGQFFKDADGPLVKELERRGLLLRAQPYEHSYPHCWRCHTPLMYYAQLSWYIRTTKIRDALLRENERTTWYPEHIKHGRYGDWLENNIDWALSRNRYWGTPLPLWRCPEGHLTCVESRAELGRLAGRDLADLDPHRPYIDEVTFACPSCGAAATRVPEVIDAWFDSGSMPFAQLGYPFVAGSEEEFARAYPARFICEAIDQTRGWFYTLMAVGTLAFDRSSYENVLCLGHIVAADGRKMSKHLGNILEPVPLMERHGADALRWFMATSGSPWVSRRIGDAALDEIVRRTLLTYWNTVSFFTLYASTAGWTPGSTGTPSALDRWLRAELHHLVGAVDAAMENFDTAGAGRLLGQFIDDLSNWYVRLSRQRFWTGDPAALATLYETIDVLTRLLAPFIPFLTERVWQVAVRPGTPSAPESVHLASWPSPAPAATRGADDDLRAQMTSVRALVEAGRAARKASGVRVRQPLARGLVGVPGADLPPELLAYVADELNVRELAGLHTAGEVVDITVKPNFRELGRRFGPRTQLVAKAIAAADPAALATGGEVTVEVAGERVTLSPEELIVSQAPRSGWAVASQRDVLVALDTTITPDLRRAGLAREVIRLVQEARKRAGLAITDRISLVWSGEPEITEAIREHGGEIAEAVLATSVAQRDPGTGDDVVDEGDLGLRFRISPAAA